MQNIVGARDMAEPDIGDQEAQWFEGLFAALGRRRPINDPSHLYYDSDSFIGRNFAQQYKRLSVGSGYSDADVNRVDEAFCAARKADPALLDAFILYYRPQGHNSPHGNLCKCAQWMRVRERTFAMTLELSKMRVIKLYKQTLVK